MLHVHVWCGQLVGADLSSVCLLGDHSWNLQWMLWLFCSFWSVLYLYLKIMSSCSHLSLVLILNHFNLRYYFLFLNYQETSAVSYAYCSGLFLHFYLPINPSEKRIGVKNTDEYQTSCGLPVVNWVEFC